MTITAGGVVISGGGGGTTNPMTTAGDIITGGASGTPGRLAVGAEGEVLTVTGGEPAWAAAAGVALSSATPAALGTAAAGSTGEASDAGHVHGLPTTTFTFADATGVTLEDGSVGGSAAVAGGVLVLTCPASPQARYTVASLEAPRGVIQIPSAGSRRPVRWRVRARLASIDAAVVAYMLACTASTARYGMYVFDPGNWGATNNTTNADFFTGTGFALDGTGWFELEYDGTQYLYFRRGTGVGAAAPTTWAEVGRGSVSTDLLTEVRLVAATYADGVERVVEWDGLTFEALP